MTVIKEKILGLTGSASGAASILGSWQVCHSACMSLTALLSVLGITVAGMPLLFLTKLAIPFWIAAFALLLVTLIIYFRKKCISSRLIIFNSGLIIAGIPFQPLQAFSKFFWLIGGLVAVTGIALFIKDKIQKRRMCYQENDGGNKK